jgi:D-alanyl-D-alanine carboxypeptidase
VQYFPGTVQFTDSLSQFFAILLSSDRMLKKKCFLLHCLISLLLVTVLSCAQESSSQASFSKQVDVLLQTTKPHPFNGVVLVSKGLQVLYHKAEGLDDRNLNKRLTRNSQFIIGSVSKQMTAGLVLREAKDQRLRLDAPIKTYLPNLSDQWANEVTIKQLLNHTSGIERLGTPLRSKPGKVFFYTNIEYDLLGQIVEKTSGKPFSVVAGEMFKFCGMDATTAPVSSTLAVLQQKLPQLATGYTEQPDGSLKTEESRRDAATNPSGGIISSASNLQRWNTCLHGGKLIAPATYQAMIDPVASAVRKHRWGEVGYGYGVQVLNQNGLLEISHSGYVPGYISTLIYYPKKQLSIVVLENTAWLTNDMGRIFFFHDEVRQLVRNLLLS